jgi:hypothetical protein
VGISKQPGAIGKGRGSFPEAAAGTIAATQLHLPARMPLARTPGQAVSTGVGEHPVRPVKQVKAGLLNNRLRRDQAGLLSTPTTADEANHRTAPNRLRAAPA